MCIDRLEREGESLVLWRPDEEGPCNPLGDILVREVIHPKYETWCEHGNAH